MPAQPPATAFIPTTRPCRLDQRGVHHYSPQPLAHADLIRCVNFYMDVKSGIICMPPCCCCCCSCCDGALPFCACRRCAGLLRCIFVFSGWDRRLHYLHCTAGWMPAGSLSQQFSQGKSGGPILTIREATGMKDLEGKTTRLVIHVLNQQPVECPSEKARNYRQSLPVSGGGITHAISSSPRADDACLF